MGNKIYLVSFFQFQSHQLMNQQHNPSGPLILLLMQCVVLLCTTSPTYIIDKNSHPTLSITSTTTLLQTLPNSNTLVQIIQGADSLALSKLLQTIKNQASQVDCSMLILYSDEVMGMMKVAVSRKAQTATELKHQIAYAKTAIGNLTQRNSDLADQKSELLIPNLTHQLQVGEQKLHHVEVARNKAQNEILIKKQHILGLQHGIELRSSSTQQQRQQLHHKKLSLTELDIEITALQSTLQQLYGKKQNLLSEISHHQEQLQALQQQISSSRTTISNLQVQIEQLYQKIDEYKKSFIVLEITIKRLQANIDINTKKEAQLDEEISMNEKEIRELEVLIDERSYYKMLSHTKILNSVLKRFEEQNNQLYYGCYGEGSMEKIVSDGITVYLVKGTEFMLFLRDNYGQGLDGQNLPVPVNFQQINVFSNEWKNTYGQAFSTSSMSSTLTIHGDFTCLNPLEVISGSGIITSIDKNIITIIQEAKTLILRIGACTRIQSTTFLPVPSQEIFYKGIQVKEGEVNLYIGSCF